MILPLKLIVHVTVLYLFLFFVLGVVLELYFWTISELENFVNFNEESNCFVDIWEIWGDENIKEIEFMIQYFHYQIVIER